jgi:hypothetical protein
MPELSECYQFTKKNGAKQLKSLELIELSKYLVFLTYKFFR